ncbi:MAG: M1 family metallopeptidase [Sphingobacteriaceae bacterium]
MHRFFFLLILLFAVNTSKAQLLTNKNGFSRADTLRGMLTPLRTCYDINYYRLNIKVDIDNRKIEGSNTFAFTADADFKTLQFDLFENLQVEKVIYKGQALSYTREFNAVFLTFPDTLKKGSKDEFTVYYSGNPIVAKDAPWDGGFVFSNDASGKAWVSVACQGLGASSWWPTKDHQSDEPDSMLISVSVPPGLMNVSNGTLRSVSKTYDGLNTYNWFVSNPINNYGVTLNIADYAHFSDTYNGESGKLNLDFYVLKENLDKAKKHFEADVKPMLKVFEHWFGPYPFYSDGYKLVETPYLGLETQSAIAYGNHYKKGYNGKDLSGTGLGLSWDFIIVHESGHEWFGNNITAKDIADMWIHESFTNYAEALFVESKYGKAAGAKYIKGLRKNIQNNSPIIGKYHVNKEGSGDMYNKGANMLHTIRSIINDDKKWRQILRGLNKEFGLKTVTTEDIVDYINRISGKDLTPVFDQYLRYTKIPVLEIKKNQDLVYYRWNTHVKDFEMPIKVKYGSAPNWTMLHPTSNWQTLKANSITIDTDNFYIETKIL